MSSPKFPRDCPCHSKLRYESCCRPFHRGEARPPSPEALMRSRYAAFSLGLGTYLVDTLATTHPDRGQPRDALVADLSKARASQRFTGLQILFSAIAEDLDRAQVLFHARIFVGTFANARDASFVELSDFVREDGAWRYAGGVSASARRFADELSELTPTTFLARVAETDGQARTR